MTCRVVLLYTSIEALWHMAPDLRLHAAACR